VQKGIKKELNTLDEADFVRDVDNRAYHHLGGKRISQQSSGSGQLFIGNLQELRISALACFGIGTRKALQGLVAKDRQTACDAARAAERASGSLAILR
jgi:hypothetical protein